LPRTPLLFREAQLRRLGVKPKRCSEL
jgi:hypothetical protein